jgi:hypothetical protein
MAHVSWFEISLVLIVAILFISYGARRSADVAVVRSSVDNEVYVIQNMPDKQDAADLLARLCKVIKSLVKHMQGKYPDNKDARRLARNFDPRNVSETGRGETYTSYTVNKGERLVFCLRERNKKNRLHELNLLVYVAIHELAHLMTQEVGHTRKFWENNKLLLNEAIALKLYRRVDFDAHPVEYCGIPIATSIV